MRVDPNVNRACLPLGWLRGPPLADSSRQLQAASRRRDSRMLVALLLCVVTPTLPWAAGSRSAGSICLPQPSLAHHLYVRTIVW